MPTLTENDIETMAKRAVDRFLSREASLADATAHEAKTGRLNTDQIERLAQAANTEGFLRNMELAKKEGAADLTREFDPVDSRQIIRIVIDQSGVHIDGQHDNAMPTSDDALPMENGMNPAEGEPGHTDSPEVEKCEESCHEKLDPPGVTTKKKDEAGFSAAPFPKGKSEPEEKKEKKEPKEEKKEASFSDDQKTAVVMRMRKVAAHLAGLRDQAHVAFEDRFESLMGNLRGVYKTAAFEEFEKSALVEHDDEISRSVLRLIRRERRLPEVDFGEKRAALLDRHISDDTRELRAFGDLCKIAHNAARLEEGVQWIKDRCAI